MKALWTLAVLVFTLLPQPVLAQQAAPPLADVALVTLPEPPPPSLNWELAIFAALQGADVASTRYVLSKGGHEGNPYMRWADTTWEMAAVKAALVAFTVVVTKAAVKDPSRRKETKVMLWVVNGLMVAVVANNVRVGRGMR